MIKVGIYGPSEIESPLRKQLLRLLLRHPDVDLRAVASSHGDGRTLSELYPVYTGETDLRLERELNIEDLDVLFVIDEENIPESAMQRFDAEDSEFRIIVLGNAPHLLEGSDQRFIYGFCEYNRKALVRGARAAVSPSPVALLLESALFPLAKNWMLKGDIQARIALPYPLGSEATETSVLLHTVQNGYDGNITLSAAEEAPYGRIDAEIILPLPETLNEIGRIYNEAYDDHNFIYVIRGRGPVDEDLRGSNKCLLRLNRQDDKLIINASMDLQTRGRAGNAVHIMNLLFGLHERTGLSI